MAIKPRKVKRFTSTFGFNGKAYFVITRDRKKVINKEIAMPIMGKADFYWSSFKPDTTTKHYFGTAEVTIYAETKVKTETGL